MMRLPAVAALALCLAGQAHAEDPKAVIGAWWTENKDGVVQIAACPAGLCGTVIGIGTFRPDGSAPVDPHGRSRCRLQIIPDGHADEDGTWYGHITNPEDGKTWTITMRVTQDGRLRMHGYIGLPVLGLSTFWTRFDKHVTPDCHIRD